MKIEKIKNKSIENQHKSNQIKYKVNTIFEIPEIHKKCEISYRKTCLKKYGVDNYSKTKEFIDTCILTFFLF